MTLLKDEAYQILLDMIKDGKIKYGQRYSLNALSSELNMSRTPVRDAIQRMCDEGRMEMLPSRGFQLHVMDRSEMLQHYHFSNAIEGYCVYQLALEYKKGKGKESVERMEYLIEELGKRLDTAVPFEDYFRYDKEFHLAIMESLDDPYFRNLKFSTMGFYDHPELQLDNKITREEIFHCHEKILRCIKAGDPHQAYDAMVEHANLMLKSVQ